MIWTSSSTTWKKTAYRVPGRLPSDAGRDCQAQRVRRVTKHCWTQELSRERKDIPNRRGFAKLEKWIIDLNLEHYGYPHPTMASYYLDDKGHRTHY
jgi:hypothetical protein